MTINTITRHQNNPNIGLKKLKKEIGVWKNMIYLRMEENIILKNALAHILRNNYNQNCLEEIEEFQNQFINEDVINDALKKEIVELDNLLLRTFEDEKTRDFFEKKVKRLRDELAQSEQRFQLLVSSFDIFKRKMYGESKN